MNNELEIRDGVCEQDVEYVVLSYLTRYFGFHFPVPRKPPKRKCIYYVKGTVLLCPPISSADRTRQGTELEWLQVIYVFCCEEERERGVCTQTYIHLTCICFSFLRCSQDIRKGLG